MNKKIKIIIIAIMAIILGLIGWHFTGLYKESKIMAEKKMNEYLEENK